jgi:very-short-patch-repair endonuclease
MFPGKRTLFTRAQATAAGYSAYQIRRRLGSGEWQTVLGDVFAPGAVPVTAVLRDRAAALAVPGSVLAAASAARLLGIEVPDRGTYLWIGSRRQPALVGVRYLRDPLSRRELMRAEGVPVTGFARTVTDCLRFLPESAGARFLDRALQAGWVTQADVVRQAHALVGRRGAPRLAKLAHQASAGAHSAAERLAVTLLRRAGLTGWKANLAIVDPAGLIGVGDLVFTKVRLLVEIDGWAFHSAPDQFQRDRSRQNRLVAAGWTVLRFTWLDLTERPDHVVATIRAMLDRLTERRSA